MKRALVIGGNSFIGKALVRVLWSRDWETEATTRATCDLLNLPEQLPVADVVFICAAMTRFIDCEDNRLAYRVNVDAPIRIAQMCHPAKVIYLSSEAVERALHTNYGMHKALAENGLRTSATIVRLSKITPDRLEDCCNFLADLAGEPQGIYHF